MALTSKDKRKDDEDNNLMSTYVNTKEKLKDVVHKMIFNKVMKIKQKYKATRPYWYKAGSFLGSRTSGSPPAFRPSVRFDSPVALRPSFLHGSPDNTPNNELLGLKLMRTFQDVDHNRFQNNKVIIEPLNSTSNKSVPKKRNLQSVSEEVQVENDENDFNLAIEDYIKTQRHKFVSKFTLKALQNRDYTSRCHHDNHRVKIHSRRQSSSKGSHKPSKHRPYLRRRLKQRSLDLFSKPLKFLKRGSLSRVSASNSIHDNMIHCKRVSSKSPLAKPQIKHSTLLSQFALYEQAQNSQRSISELMRLRNTRMKKGRLYQLDLTNRYR